MALKLVKTYLEDTNTLKNILEFAVQSEENYKMIRCQILHREIYIPKVHRACIMKIFKSRTLAKRNLVGEEFHNWLQSFLEMGEHVNPVQMIDFTTSDYIILAGFLKNTAPILKNQKKTLLSSECHYGYFLESFFQAHMDKLLRGTINQKFSEVIKEEFDISDRYGRQLRWLGRLWCQYPKIGNLNMSLYKLYGCKKELENFLNNYPTLAKNWKNEEPVEK